MADTSAPPAYNDVINSQKLASPQQNYPHQSSSVAFNAYQEYSLHLNLDQFGEIRTNPKRNNFFPAFCCLLPFDIILIVVSNSIVNNMKI